MEEKHGKNMDDASAEIHIFLTHWRSQSALATYTLALTHLYGQTSDDRGAETDYLKQWSSRIQTREF